MISLLQQALLNNCFLESILQDMERQGVRNFLGMVDVVSVGSRLSLDSQNGDSSRTLYYKQRGDLPYEEISLGDKPFMISDKRTVSRADPLVFSLYDVYHFSIPGGEITLEKLSVPSNGEPETIHIAQIVPFLGDTNVNKLKSLDEDTRILVLSDLVRYYPKFVITQGNIFEAYLGEMRAFLDSPGFEHPAKIEGFADAYQDKKDGWTDWKIAKEYPQKKNYTTTILRFGLRYLLPDMDIDSINQRTNEFVKNIELGGKDTLDMIERIAVPSVEIREQGLYS